MENALKKTRTGSDEEMSTKIVLEIGRRYGYGNLIVRLRQEWIRELMEYGLSEEAAKLATDLPELQRRYGDQ